MFWNKQKKEIDRLILGDENIYKTTDVIDVKIESKEQIFSAYSYSGDKLNTEFSEYISDKAKSVSIKEPIKIKIGQALELHHCLLLGFETRLYHTESVPHCFSFYFNNSWVSPNHIS